MFWLHPLGEEELVISNIMKERRCGGTRLRVNSKTSGCSKNRVHPDPAGRRRGYEAARRCEIREDLQICEVWKFSPGGLSGFLR